MRKNVVISIKLIYNNLSDGNKKKIEKFLQK